MIGLSVIGADRVAAIFARSAAAAPVRAEAKVRHWTNMLHALVRANASGPPGPGVRTGEYRASIQQRIVGGGAVARGEVFTDHPASRRLELGFVGADSLGRVYNDPPRPHFAPAVALVEEAFVDDFRREPWVT